MLSVVKRKPPLIKIFAIANQDVIKTATLKKSKEIQS